MQTFMTNNLYAHRGFMLPSARWAHGILCTSVYYTLGKASEKRFLRLCPAQRTSLTHPYTYCKFCPIAFLEIGLDFRLSKCLTFIRILLFLSTVVLL